MMGKICSLPPFCQFRLPSASSAQTALEDKFNKSQCLAAKSLDILINPQFGELNYSDFSVVAAPSTLSATQTSTLRKSRLMARK